MEKVTVMADGQNDLSLKNELVDPASTKVRNINIKSTFNPEKKQKKYRESEKEEELTDPNNIKIKNFKITSEGNDLLINGHLLVAHGKRYGLVGLENYGKTALLKHIANIPKGIDVLYWDQGIVDDTLPAIKAVLKPSTRCCELIAERAKLMAELESGNDSDEVVNRLAELWEELLMIDPDGMPAEKKASNILFGLGFTNQDLKKTMIELTEHLRKKLSLARALYLEPTLLILEEPTTDLDLDAILWLENYLQDWAKAMIVVSQDRCFLDNVCSEIIQVNQQQFCYFKGNYSFFEKRFAQKQIKSLKKKEKKLQFEAKRKSIDAGVKSQIMTRNQSRNKCKMPGSGENTPPAEVLQKSEFWFLDPTDFKRKNFLQVADLTFAYEKNKPIFNRLGLGISYKQIITILGPSQAGKTTLFKLATNELEPQKGSVSLKPGTTIGKFSESVINNLPSAENPLEYLCKKAGDEESFKQKAVDQLSSLGLPSKLHTTKMGELTANDKALVVLAEFCTIPHDGIFLHEPERFMDLKIIDALADAMNLYKGGILLVTNNEYLIQETRSGKTEVCVIKKGILKEIDDFDKYRKKVLTRLNVPVKGLFIFKKRTELGRETSPARKETDSEIILNYIKENNDVDPAIKNIGKYRIIFRECAKEWRGYTPTLGANSYGKTKELCHKNVIDAIEEKIEQLIKYKQEVPSPP